MTHPPIPVANSSELIRWLLRQRRRVRVVGASMEPTLVVGDVVLVDVGAYRSSLPEDGDVVVALHPQQPDVEIVKRVDFTDENGVYLRSDNTDDDTAADSRRFGMVAFEDVIGRVNAKVGRS